MVVIMIRKLLQFYTCLLVSCLIIGCSFQPKTTIKLGKQAYRVPIKNLFSTNLERKFQGLATDKGSYSIHLIFEPEELKQAIPDYSILAPGSELAGYVRDILTVLVYPQTDRDKNGEFWSELWRGTGSYSPDRLGPRIVKYDSDVGLYRVYRKQIESFWVFTRINPEAVKDKLPDNNMVVAVCSDTVRVEPSYSCQLAYYQDEISIDLSLSKTNFVHREKIIDFIYNKLDEWEVK